jgi:hypothetical protein
VQDVAVAAEYADDAAVQKWKHVLERPKLSVETKSARVMVKMFQQRQLVVTTTLI